jgi:hypothetical protein
MNKEELAKLLDGSEYPFRLNREIGDQAKEDDLLVIYGMSDDLMELYGAIRDEYGCFDGGSFMIDDQGILLPWDEGEYEDEESAEQYFKRKPKAKMLEALWCEEEEYSWTYKTDIPYACFDIVEDGEKYCRGIVIDLKDLR